MQGPCLLRTNWTTRRQSHHGTQCDQRTTGNTRRRLVHARHGWRISFTKTEAQGKFIPLLAFLLAGCCLLGYAEPFDGRNVIGSMYQPQFFVCSGTQGELARFVATLPQAAALQQIHHGGQPAWLHGMRRAKVVS